MANAKRRAAAEKASNHTMQLLAGKAGRNDSIASAFRCARFAQTIWRMKQGFVVLRRRKTQELSTRSVAAVIKLYAHRDSSASAVNEEDHMFADRNATAMIPCSDLARAKAWYSDKLGLTPTRDLPEAMGALYELKGVQAMLYTTQFAGTAGNTMLTFQSPDVAADVAALRARGVVFLDYDFPGLKTENGIATFAGGKNAWCKDSEGNILAFVEGM